MRRLLGMLVVALSLGLASAAHAAVPQPVYFWSSTALIIAGPGRAPLPMVIRPATIVLFADGSWDVEHLRWSGWGSSVARATGVSSASNGIPDQAEGKRIKTRARVTLSKPGRFEGHEVYRCFTLTLPSKPRSDQHLCLKRQGGYWGLAPTATPPHAVTDIEFIAPTIGGGCSMTTLRVICETYAAPGQVARLEPSGATTICVLHGSTTCDQGNFGERTPHYGVGKKAAVGRFRCAVLKAGVRCTVAGTGKGFLISRTTTVRVGPSY